MDSVSTAGSAPNIQKHQFEFTGSGGEYFRIWIVNLLLTLLTLGIYGAWAKVRRLRYFYGNTLLAGSSFEYHGEPVKILKGRLIATAILVPTYLAGGINPVLAMASSLLFLVALPFIIVRSRRFQMRMTSWRNIRFDFAGSYGEAIAIYVGKALLTGLTLGLYYPSFSHSKFAFVIGQSKFGTARTTFNATRSSFYATYSLAGLILVAGLVVAIGLAVTAAGPTFDLQESIAQPDLASPASLATLVKVIFVFVLAIGIAATLSRALIQARLSNLAFGNTWVGQHRLQSKLPVLPLAWIHISNLALILITAGLYAPWAKVRVMRFQMENMSLIAQDSLDEFVASETANISAAGEEIGDFLDVDFGL